MDGGRSERAREKAGDGKIVRALTRMLVTVSGWRRWGLNWYLRGRSVVCEDLLLMYATHANYIR